MSTHADTKRIAVIRPPAVSDQPEVPARFISPGFELSVVPMRASVLPTDGVGMMLNELATVEACTRAQFLSYDGVLIADYGIGAARSAVRIPVVGSGQASMLTAAGLGRRFGVVTIWPESTGHVYRSSIESYGLTHMFSGVRHVSVESELATLADEDNFYSQTRAGKEHMLERVLEQIDAAVRQDGADTIVFGCNCMTPVADILAERSPVPVIEPIRTGYKMLESLVTLGLTQSPAAYRPVASDPSAMLAELVEVTAKAVEAGKGEDCDVCVMGESFFDDDAAEAAPAASGR
jgi:allantoin racemase